MNGADVQANGIAYSGSFAFIAYGAAGAVVTKANADLNVGGSEAVNPLDTFGRLIPGGTISANDIHSFGNKLAVAGGSGGVLLIDIDAAPSGSEVSAAVGFNDIIDDETRYINGFVWADFNQDGHLDLITTGTVDDNHYENDGDGTFTNVGDLGRLIDNGMAVLDVNDDGAPDFIGVGNSSRRDVFVNDGTGSFSRYSSLVGTIGGDIYGVFALDANDDGRTDFVHCGQNRNSLNTNLGTVSPPSFNEDTVNASGLSPAGAFGPEGYALATADVNNDGYLDVFFVNAGGHLLLSNGDGTFTKDNRGITVASNTVDGDVAGLAWADYDNDGDVDLWVSDRDDMNPGQLYRNDGATFTEVAASAGLTSTADHKGACWGDYDSDGDLDLFLPVDDQGPATASEHYRNNGDGTFQLVSDGFSSVVGENEECVWVDYDNDGDLDLYVMAEDQVPTLVRSDASFTNYLFVRAIGRGVGGSSRIGRGTRIELYAADGTTFIARREPGTQQGGNPEPLRAHFGGLSPSSTYIVRVYFRTGTISQSVVPSAATTTIGSTTIANMLTINEP